MYEGAVVYHKPTQSKCTIVSLYDGKATIRTEDNMVLECNMFDLATELNTMNVY